MGAYVISSYVKIHHIKMELQLFCIQSEWIIFFNNASTSASAELVEAQKKKKCCDCLKKSDHHRGTFTVGRACYRQKLDNEIVYLFLCNANM